MNLTRILPLLSSTGRLYLDQGSPLEVFLEAFEGPLDLLLYLIKRQNLDILDIPVATITMKSSDTYSTMVR